MSERTPRFYTLLGILAILLWSTSFAFSRDLAESLGVLTAASRVFLIGGAMMSLFVLRTKTQRERLRQFSNKYVFACGFLYVSYLISIYLGIGLSVSRQQVIEVTLINYLWPSITLLFSVPILSHNVRWPTLILGILLASIGVGLSITYQSTFSIAHFVETFELAPAAYLCAVYCAISWPLYSNLSRKYAPGGGAEYVPLFSLAVGLIFYVAARMFTETPSWNTAVIFKLLYQSLGPCCMAYWFWALAVKKGDFTTVAAASYFAPFLATIFSCLYLGVALSWSLLAACVLIVAGSIISKLSLNAQSTR